MQAGTYITDGTVRWLVVDIRDGSMVGDITYSPILRPGHVKANGALLASASVNYPRLVSFAVDNGLTVADDTAWESNKAAYVYDDVADTLRVPDAGGRVLQGGDAQGSEEAGLPNITGSFQVQNSASGGRLGIASTVGAFFTGDIVSGVNNASAASAYSTTHEAKLNASRSSSIYSASQTVQPPALTQIAQIRY